MNAHSLRQTARATGKSNKRAAIERAALELFVERGFHGTTVPEIARRAGVGTGTLYLYHCSKDRLLNSLYQQWCTACFARLHAAARNAHTPRETFSAYWHSFVGFSHEHPAAYSFWVMYESSPYLSDETRRLEVESKRPLETLFEDGAARKVFKPLPIPVLMAAGKGLFTELKRLEASRGLVLTPALWRAAEEMVWEAMRR